MGRSISELLAKRNEDYVASRIDHERWVERLFRQLDNLDKKDYPTDNMPTGRTAQEIFPSLYNGEFSIQAYEAEKEKFYLWYNKVLEYRTQINTEAEMQLFGGTQ